MDASSMDMAFQKGDIDILDCLMLDSAIVESTYKTKYAKNIPSGMIMLLVLSFNFLGDALRDILDPKTSQSES